MNPCYGTHLQAYLDEYGYCPSRRHLWSNLHELCCGIDRLFRPDLSGDHRQETCSRKVQATGR